MEPKELDFILQEGEGYRIEFKENLSNLDKEMCAFANASGGRIFLGISDDRAVRGIHVTNALKSQIHDIARNCGPAVTIILEEWGNVLIVEVREGTDKPYRCSGGFYNRIGPNSQKIRRDEIIEFVTSEGKIRFEELICRPFSDADFDEEKLDLFLRRAKLSRLLSTPQILRNLHTADIQEGKTWYTNCAVLFFAKQLDHFHLHATVTCALYKGNDKVHILDRKDFNRDLIFNVDETMLFLERHLSVRYEFDGSPARKEIPEIPFEALREAVINAVIHRDYFEKGANVMVEIFDNRIEITSPGGLPKGLKPEDFGTVSLLRNPNIANLFQRIEYIEKMGTGIRRIQNMMADAELPPVKYQFSAFVKAIFFRQPLDYQQIAERRVVYSIPKRNQKTTQKTTQKNITQKQQAILAFVQAHPEAGRNKIAAALGGITADGVKYNLKTLQQKGLLRRVGPAKGGHWEVTENTHG